MSIERLHVELYSIVKQLPGFSGATTLDDCIAGRDLPAELLCAEPSAKTPSIFLAEIANRLPIDVDPHRFVVVGIAVFRNKSGHASGGGSILVVLASQASNCLLVIGFSDDLEIEVSGWWPMVCGRRQWRLLPGWFWRPTAGFESRPLFVPVPDSPESKEDHDNDEPIHAHSFQGR